MKVIFVNRFFYPDLSATSQILTDLAFDLALHGTDVRVITSRQKYDDPKAELPFRAEIGGVTIYRVWTTRFGRAKLASRALDYLSFYASVFWYLLCLVSRGDVLIVKTDPPFISVVAMVAAKLRGAVLINWAQDLFPEVAVALKTRGVNGAFSGLLKWLRNISFKSAQVNVVIGERMADCLKKEGINSGKIKVIHNWSDGDVVKPFPREKNELRKKWDLDGKFVIAYSGNMGRAHEFDTILETAKILKNETNFVFLFIGGGQKRAWIENEVRKHALSNFLFKPYQPYTDLSESLSVGDVHLISLRPQLEGLIVPSKFYGIAAVGRPAIFIGDPNGEIPRILLEEKCGFTVPVGDSMELARIIRMLAENRDVLNSLGSNARAAFERRFNRPLAMESWKEVLSDFHPAV